MERQTVYTVTQVNSYLYQMFSSDPFLARIYVKGEVSNCKYHSSGHIYFSLKDEQAQISCVMFASSRRKLAFHLEDGQRVIVFGSMGIWQKGGSYQLYASAIRLDGIGILYERYEALKKELEERGMFDPMYKKALPRYIRTLGVVTAPTGAAVRDIINVSRRRNAGIQIILYPALVQGQGAAQSIARGIEPLDAAGVDTIIVGRGGGSIEDLWAFNEEVVAQAIFDADTPIISAVGHETDFTIADFVADMRAPTPSAAAEIAVDDMAAVLESVKALEGRLSMQMLQKTGFMRKEAESYHFRLKAHSPSVRLREMMLELDQLSGRMDGSLRRRLTDAASLADRYASRLNIDGRIRESQSRVKFLAAGISADMRQMISKDLARWGVFEARISALSPQNHLDRGYAYLSSGDGKPVRSVLQVKTGEELDVTLRDGRLKTRVLAQEVSERSGRPDGRE